MSATAKSEQKVNSF